MPNARDRIANRVDQILDVVHRSYELSAVQRVGGRFSKVWEMSMDSRSPTIRAKVFRVGDDERYELIAD